MIAITAQVSSFKENQLIFVLVESYGKNKNRQSNKANKIAQHRLQST